MTKTELEELIREVLGKRQEDLIRKEVVKAVTKAIKSESVSPFSQAKDISPVATVGKTYRELFGKDDSLSDDGFEDVNEFYKLIHSGRHDPRLKTMTETSGSGGGFLVPEQFAATLLDSSLEDEIVRPRCQVWKMDSESLKIPGFEIGDHSSNLFGGVIGRWGSEAASKTEGAPAIRQIALKVKKLYCFAKSSDELIGDSKIPFEKLIGPAFIKGIGWYLDYAFLQGTGGGQPLGILNSNCIVEVSKESGQEKATIVYENLTNMLSRLYPGGWKNAIWIAHTTTIPQLLSLGHTTGTGGWHYQVFNESNGKYTILGRPAVFTEKLPVVGDAGDIMLCDLTQYAVGLKQDVRMESSIHADFQSDITQFRAVLRPDGQPTWNETLTLKDGATEVSPFIRIEARE